MKAYATECDLLNPYPANFSILEKTELATDKLIPFFDAPSINFCLCTSISFFFFFPIALRNKSASPRE